MGTYLAALAAIGTALGAQAQATAGTIRSDEVTIEILAPARDGEIRTPEGFIRVEPGQQPEEGQGSFAVVQADTLDAGGAAAFSSGASAGQPAGAGGSGIEPTWAVPARDAGLVAPPPLARRGALDTAAPQPGPDPCREQRRRYVRQLLRSAGIDVDDPAALFQGLAGPAAYGGDLLASGYFLSGIDPIRPLAWDMELRSIARDLSTCESRSAPAAPR